jgi:hypothetical protein
VLRRPSGGTDELAPLLKVRERLGSRADGAYRRRIVPSFRRSLILIAIGVSPIVLLLEAGVPN